ncbi:phosphate signaling complex protein PhoU, partial [Bifidobacterium animalis]
ITKATEAILEGKEEQAREVIQADEEIDQAEKDIERLCLRLLLQQQPVAKDLRQISAALKMITDMERIGDQASDIAEILLSTDLKVEKNNKDIGVMAQAAAKMVRESVRAYVEQNMMLAKKVMTADDEVDRLFDKIRQEIIDYIAKEGGDGGEAAVDLIMVAKYLERIGDHATNIAEWVEFSITGNHRIATEVHENRNSGETK